MLWHIAIYIVTIFISIALMVFLAAYSWRHRDVQGAAAFGAICLLCAWGALAEFLSMISGTPETAVLWFDARFISLSGIPVIWLVFSLQYSGRSAWTTLPRIITLLVIPLITQVMVWTNALHGLWLKSNVGFFQAGPFLIADTSQRVPGPWFMVHTFYGYASLAIGVVLLVNMAARLMRDYRGQALTLAAGTAVLTVGSAIPTFNLVPGLKVNPIVQGLSLGAVIFSWAIFRYRFLGIVPVARDLLIDSIEDGMLVLDMKNRIIDVNRTMLSLIAEALGTKGSAAPKRIIGMPFMEVFHPWREVVALLEKEMNLATEVEGAIAGQVRVFNVKMTPLVGKDGVTQGRLIIVSDITERKRSDEIINIRLRLIDFSARHTLAELLQNALDEVCAVTGSTIGFYHFVEPDQMTLSLQAWSTRTEREFCKAKGKGMHYRVDEAGVWVDCIHQRRPVIHNDYASLPHRKGMPEGHAEVVRELVVPILREDKIVAILGVGNKPQDYTDGDIEIVSYLADVAWEIARRKRAEEALRESEHALLERNLRMEHDLKIAQMAQKGMIQGIRPKCDRLAIEYRYKPMEKVGGDYFSFFMAEDQSLGFFIGDVSGHGLASALFIALLKAFTDRMFRVHGKDPSGYLKNLNGELIDYMVTYFVTGIYGVFDSCGCEGDMSLKFSNGGHTMPILVRRGGGAAFTGLSGDIIGISNDVKYSVCEERLRAGDRVFVYTDGIPETMNEEKVMIDSEGGMLALFNRCQRGTLSETLDAIIKEVNLFRGSIPVLDDITLIGFEVV